uniref:Nucleotide-sugar transporter family protein n=1 Tax=Parastrongyloides trichosuri TaxID=131310 RepID=A0A0N5A0S1_PARTI
MAFYSVKISPIDYDVKPKEIVIEPKSIDEDKLIVKNDNDKSFLFKIYIILGLTISWGLYNILIKYTVLDVKEEDQFFSPVLPVLCESLKLIFAFILYFRESNFSIKKFCNGIYNEIILKPKDFLKISPAAVGYILQNNLEIISAQNLDPGIYQVTSQIKIVSSALFMVLFLKQNQSFKRWICIFLMFVGIVISPLGEEMNKKLLIGLISVLITSIFTGFASVYFEKMLKNGTQSSLWLRSIQLYIWGIFSAIICLVSKNTSGIIEKGVFHGFTHIVWLSMIVLAIGGIYNSMIIKYINSLYKCFASTLTITLVSLISVFLFHVTLSLSFIISFSIVVLSVIAYNLVS